MKSKKERNICNFFCQYSYSPKDNDDQMSGKKKKVKYLLESGWEILSLVYSPLVYSIVFIVSRDWSFSFLPIKIFQVKKMEKEKVYWE